MGVAHVNVVIRIPANPARSWEARSAVHARAMDSPVSRQPPDTIDLKPKGKGVDERTDGSRVEKDLTTGDIEITCEMTPGPSSSAMHMLNRCSASLPWRRSEAKSTHKASVWRRRGRSGFSETRRDE